MIPAKKFTILLLTAFMWAIMSGPVVSSELVKIIINKKVNKLAYLKNGQVIKVFPVATGRKPGYTPEGKWKVVRKVINPYYNKLKIPGGSPKNPLGVRWLGLNALGTSGGTYGIHGTNNPSSIGKYASAGCIRMYNKDVIWLYKNTPLYTPVEIINRNWDLKKEKASTEPKPVNINIKGKILPQNAGNKPYMVNDRVMVPCRQVAEAMGYSVKWIANKQKVVFNNGKNEVSTAVGSNMIYVNGSHLGMDQRATLSNGRVFLHIRAIVEAFGYQVSWDGQTRTVYISN